MENFRDFQAGPDPFDRMWHVQFKYLQTAISIRHSDSVDVRFILENGEEWMQKTVVIPLADIRDYTERTSQKVSDPWCSRLAKCKIRDVIATAEDLDKDYIFVTPREIELYAAKIRNWEEQWVKEHAA